MALADIPSHVAGATLLDMVANTITMNLDDSTAGRFKVSLWRNAETGTPASIVEETYLSHYGNTTGGSDQFYVGGSNHYNEPTDWGAGYTAGGQNLSIPTVACSAGSGVLVWSAAGLSWSGANGANTHTIRGLKIDYCATAGTPSRPFVFLNLGADWPLDSGSFTVAWDPTFGIFNWEIL
jgi:hypothetical protein